MTDICEAVLTGNAKAAAGTSAADILHKVVIGTVAGDLHDIGKVMIGGAPVTQAFADQVGAEGYAESAGGASRMAKALLEAR